MSSSSHPTLPEFSRDQLFTLLEEVASGESKPDQLVACEQLLLGSEPARELAVRYLHMDALLARYGMGVERSPIIDERLNVDTPHDDAVAPTDFISAYTAESPATVRTEVRGWRIALAPKWISIAASLLLVGYFVGMALFLSQRHEGQEHLAERSVGMAADSHISDSKSEMEAVATIRDSADVEWSKASAPRLTVASTRGQTITAGELLSITAGLIELQLKQGTTLLIEGPAEWTIEGDNNATLKRGKLVAKVPKQAIGFTLDTPTARIVDLGTEFGVEVSKSRATEVHVLRGRVDAIKLAADGTQPLAAKSVRLEAGSAIRFESGSTPDVRVAFEKHRFAQAREKLAFSESTNSTAFTGAILLGKLFDDRSHTPLTKAMMTDTYAAVPDSDHLGIQSVFFDGEPIKQIAPQLFFDFSSLGWNPDGFGVVSNAGVFVPGCLVADGPPLDTQSKLPFTKPSQKKEDGIGMHADAVITFNLERLRQAANRPGQSYRFVAERAGVNGPAFGAASSLYMLVVVANDEAVLAAYLNGDSAEFSEHEDVWRVVKHNIQPMRADHHFVSYMIDLTAEAKYLMLAATDSGDGPNADHAVWSGARLEPREEK